MSEQQEIRNKRIGLIASISIHAVLGLLFLFVIAWKAPYPPAREYGIELNFGLDDAGSGEVQPESTQPRNISSGEENPAEETDLQGSDEAVPQPDRESMEETTTPETATQEESPVQEEKVNPEPGNTNPVDKIKTDVKQTETKNDRTQTSDSQETTDAAGNENKNTSQGDQMNAKGDQGNPEGKIDARALYGTQGGGQGGSSLDMAGWIWDFEPKPNDTSNQSGKIVFEIKVNDRGELTSVRTLEKTVSPEVEKIYREAVEELTFSPLSTNVRPPASSTGRITFIIQSR